MPRGRRQIERTEYRTPSLGDIQYGEPDVQEVLSSVDPISGHRWRAV